MKPLFLILLLSLPAPAQMLQGIVGATSGAASPPAHLIFRNAATSLTATVAKPTGVVNDDLLFTAIMTANTGAYPTITTLPGWTPILTQDYPLGTYGVRLALYYKIASGEGANYAWTISTNVVAYVHCAAWYNANPSPFVAGQSGSGAYTTGTTTPTATGITTSEAYELVVTVFADTSGFASTWTPPAGMTERSDAGGIEIADVLQTASGASGNKQATRGTSGVGLWAITAFRSAVP